jgi:transposase
MRGLYYYPVMLKRKTTNQSELEFVSIETLVPKDHLLRKIDRHIDFGFIYDKVEHLYCKDNGRPPVDPVMLFRMLLVGYLFGIRSERRLEQEIRYNVAYRWFLGLGLTGQVPDHSTISRNRIDRFAGTDIFQEVFDEIVMQAIRKKLVDGKTLYTDSTHLKASANKGKHEKKLVRESVRAYAEELDTDIVAEREAHGKQPLKPKDDEGPKQKEIKSSTTDPDSGFMHRDGKPKGFFYLDHRTVDAKHALITDVHVTPGNVHDSVPYLDRLDRQTERFDFDIKAVGVDSGYNTAAICKGLADRDIYGVMPYKRPMGKPGMLKKRDFTYDEHYDCYLCPKGQVLNYSTTNREGHHEYKSDPAICAQCPRLKECTTSRNHQKVITRHIWEKHKEAVNDHRYEERGKRIYKRRKETVERSFADAKELHGHRYARFRGLDKVQEQCLMAACAQNIKKMALLLDRERSERLLAFIYRLMGLISAHLNTLCETFFERPEKTNQPTVALC